MKLKVLFAACVLACCVLTANAQGGEGWIADSVTRIGSKYNINGYQLVEGQTKNFRGTTTYYGMAGFNSSQYEQGYLRNSLTGANGPYLLNYRLLKPKSYNKDYNPGYPLIVVMHGVGEIGNCKKSSPNSPYVCYHSNVAWNANSNSPVASPTNLKLLNNDHHLANGGKAHLDAVNLANGKLPNDPTLHARAFPGFVLFSQSEDAWDNGSAPEINNTVRIIRLLMKKYKIDPNRIYIHGLSNGGEAVYRMIKATPWLFACALPMSAIGSNAVAESPSQPIAAEVESIPMWIFQGGIDNFPKKAATENRVYSLKTAGVNVRYYLYPKLGHGTWYTAYSEPDFFSWILAKNKANPTILWGSNEICYTAPSTGVTMVFSKGFFAYQWQRKKADNTWEDVGFTYNYKATVAGTYRARFSRVSAPGTTGWNRWSDEIVIKDQLPTKPTMTANYTTIFPLDLNTTPAQAQTFVLKSDKIAEKYRFSYGTSATQFLDYGQGLKNDTIRSITVSGSLRGTNPYTLKIVTLGNSSAGCTSVASDPKFAHYSAPSTITAPSNFKGTVMSNTSIMLSWTDNSANEKGFEVWRRVGTVNGVPATNTPFSFVTLTAEDAVSFLDTKLSPGTTYHYKLRAINNASLSAAARSPYAPGNALTNNLVVTTTGDTKAPTSPQNLTVTARTISSISLGWTASTDASGIKQYIVYYKDISTGITSNVQTGSTATTYVLTGLAANKTYSITVRAQDNANPSNTSNPSNQVTGSTYITGLTYEHTAGGWDSLSYVDWRQYEFEGSVPNFSLEPRIQENFFNFKFFGYLYINTPGDYQFRVTSDDGSMLYLDGFNPVYPFTVGNQTDPPTRVDLTQFRVIKNDGVRDTQAAVTSAVKNMTAGPHQITLLYFQSITDHTLLVEYVGPDTGGSWMAIPDAALRTGNYTPPALPNPPTGLTAVSNGMTSINLSWSYSGAGTDAFEVYRSLSSSGNYEIVGLASGTSYSDTDLNAATTYYYKLRTVNDAGVSTFSNIASAATTADTEAPTVPSNLELLSKTFTNIAFKWDQSTDNIGVTGYQVFIDGVLKGTTVVPSYMASGLEPRTTYHLSVKAFDAASNVSGMSAILIDSTNVPHYFYTKANNINLSVATNWADDGGASPSFTDNGNYYVVKNSNTFLGNDLVVDGNISRVIVDVNRTLNVTYNLQGKIEVRSGAQVLLNYPITPNFVSIAPSSTVSFISVNTVPVANYGNVKLQGAADKNFEPGTTVINGSLELNDGITMKGAPSNATRVEVGGNVTINGVPGFVAADNTIDLALTNSTSQNISLGGDLDLYQISTEGNATVNVINTGGNPITMTVGSTHGGGIKLGDGSTLNIGSTKLVTRDAALINPENRTGKISIDNAAIELNSSNAGTSYLNFDATNNKNIATMVTANLFGGGIAAITSPLKIVDGLKVKDGQFNGGNGNVTLVSNATKTAYLQQIENSGSVTGTLNIQRWIGAIGNRYRYISSPAANVKVADWQKYIPISGPFTGRSTNVTSPAKSSMFYYHEPGYLAFPPSGGTNQATLERGVGYSVFLFRGTSNINITSTGTPYQGNIPFPLTTPAPDGWNLLGNPYASAVAWRDLGWIRNNIHPTVKVRDNAEEGVFKVYDLDILDGDLVDGIIAPGQAFWVQALSPGASLTITEQAKVLDEAKVIRDRPSRNLMVEMSNGTLSDKTFIAFNERFADQYEQTSDALKMPGSSFVFSSRVDGHDLAINKLSDSFCEKTVPLNIQNATPGQYTLSFHHVASLAGVGVGIIELTDHFTNTTTTITDDSDYAFSVSSDAASSGTDRFALTFKRGILTKEAVAVAQNVCGDQMAIVNLSNTQAGAEYFVMDTHASVISDRVVSEGGTLTLNIPVASLIAGTNTVQVMTGFRGCASEPLATTTTLDYAQKAQAAVPESYLSICDDARVTLTASGAPAGGSYRWYNPKGEVISGATGAALVTEPAKSAVAYQVSAVTSSGCEGDKAMVIIEPEHVDAPIVEFDGKALTVVGGVRPELFVQWYKDNQALDAYQPFLQADEAGSYSVLVSSNGCSRISDGFDFNILSEESPLDGFAAYVYPNPAKSSRLYVRIETPSKQTAEITLTDLSGRPIVSETVAQPQGAVHHVKVGDVLPPAVYLISVKQGSNIIKRKVVIIN